MVQMDRAALSRRVPSLNKTLAALFDRLCTDVQSDKVTGGGAIDIAGVAPTAVSALNFQIGSLMQDVPIILGPIGFVVGRLPRL